MHISDSKRIGGRLTCRTAAHRGANTRNTRKIMKRERAVLQSRVNWPRKKEVFWVFFLATKFSSHKSRERHTAHTTSRLKKDKKLIIERKITSVWPEKRDRKILSKKKKSISENKTRKTYKHYRSRLIFVSARVNFVLWSGDGPIDRSDSKKKKVCFREIACFMCKETRKVARHKSDK